MAPVSRGWLYCDVMPTCLLFAVFMEMLRVGSCMTRSSNTSLRNNHKGGALSAKDIEDFVKRLEYEAGHGVDNSLDGVVVDLDLLSQEDLAEDIVRGLQEEFSSVDQALGDNNTVVLNGTASVQSFNKTAQALRARQLSLLFQGVYAPDPRFNAFVDGVMVNMVAEMKRKRMDPLYFRVYDRGVIEHVATRSGRASPRSSSGISPPQVVNTIPPADPNSRRHPAGLPSKESMRSGRQETNASGTAIGGGVIRGLTNVKRFGNAEVQVAGNMTLVRSHYVYGPLNIELVFETAKGVKTINSTLTALAAHALAEVNDNSSKLVEFLIDSPLDYEVMLIGTRSALHRRVSQSAIMRMFKPTGKLERRLLGVYKKARQRPIQDVVAKAATKKQQQLRKPGNETSALDLGNNAVNGTQISKVIRQSGTNKRFVYDSRERMKRNIT